MRILAYLALLLALCTVADAQGVPSQLYCNTGTGGLNQWAPCSAANPLQTTGGGGGGGNAAASATGSAVPADADYQGLNIGGTLRGQTGVNPTGSVYAGQTDVSSVNGVSLGSPSAYGTSPGAVNVVGVNAAITNALPAGSAIIGKVGIDQTTAGTTNGISIVGVNAATALAGAGAVGTGAQRVAVGQDTTTLAGSAPGTAGTASANVVTVQGVASMTPVQVNQTQIGGTAIVADPCQSNVKLPFNVSQTSSGTLITGTSAKKNYICSIVLLTSAAANVGLVEYSGTCTGGTAFAIYGSTTAANGPSFAANGGLTMGNGTATVLSGSGNTNTGYNVCALQNGSATVNIAGTYVQQ